MVAGRGTWATNDVITAAGLNSGWDGSGNPIFTANGTLVSVVQKYRTGIDTGNTDTLVFAFTPSKIELRWSGKCRGVDASDYGVGTGGTVIIITGTNTFTSQCNSNSAVWNAGTSKMSGVTREADTTNLIYFNGGYTSNVPIVSCVGVWTTASNTMTLTWTSTNMAASGSATSIEIIATAYR